MIIHANYLSKTLDMETNITVITPRDMTNAKKYRIVYLLHGLCGSSSDWLTFTQLPLLADFSDKIFICPEVQRSFYTDMTYGLNYFTYVSEELPKIVGGTFNICQDRENTIVMGASMGGYGALRLALTYPERFGTCIAFAPCSLFLKEYLQAPYDIGIIKGSEMKSIYGENFEYKEDYDIGELAKKTAKSQLKPKIYMACGYHDFLYEDNHRFSQIMKTLGYDYTYEEWEGTHGWYFFNEAMIRAFDYLKKDKEDAK